MVFVTFKERLLPEPPPNKTRTRRIINLSLHDWGLASAKALSRDPRLLGLSCDLAKIDVRTYASSARTRAPVFRSTSSSENPRLREAETMLRALLSVHFAFSAITGYLHPFPA